MGVVLGGVSESIMKNNINLEILDISKILLGKGKIFETDPQNLRQHLTWYV